MAKNQSNLRLMTSILCYLKRELTSNYLDSEQQEGVNVAVKCLESVYGCNDRFADEPSLEEVYNSFVRKSDASAEDKAKAESLKNEGNAFMKNLNFDEAIETYAEAIRLDPNNAIYYSNRAAAHSKLHNLHQSLADCKKAIEINPSYCKAHARLGQIYSRLDDYQSALGHFRIAFELEPDNERYKNSYDLTSMILNEQESQPSVQPSNEAQETPTTGCVSESAPTLIPIPSDVTRILNDPMLIDIAAQLLMDPNLQAVVEPLVDPTVRVEENIADDSHFPRVTEELMNSTGNQDGTQSSNAQNALPLSDNRENPS